jgi:hypothetical protein
MGMRIRIRGAAFLTIGELQQTTQDLLWYRDEFSEALLLNVTLSIVKTELFLSRIFLPTFESETLFHSIFT